MGSATTHAQSAATAALDAVGPVDLGVAHELFAAARALGGTSQLSGALFDSTAPAGARVNVVADVFAGFQPTTVSLLQAVVAERWSSEDDLITGIEDLAIRAAAIADAGADVDGELFELIRAIAGNAELELALGSRLGGADAKGALVESILKGRASSATILIASSLVQHPRERRVRSLLTHALRLVADQRGRTVATVYTAAPLSDAQRTRLERTLGQRYDAEVSLNVVVDPTVVGGLRIEIGDDVIDATVSSRLNDLRQKLAG